MSRERSHIQLVSGGAPPEPARGADAEAHWAALVRQAQAGDVGAFERLASQHYEAVFAFSVGLTGDRAEAADVAQEALIKAFRRLSTYRFAASFRSWLLQVARNTFRDRVRAEQQRRAKTRRLTERTVAPAQRDPEGQLLDKQQSRQIYEALGEVEPVFREVVVLFDLQGFAYREIAEICDVPMGTVKSRLRRGRDALRQRLVERGIVGPGGRRPAGRDRG